MNVDVVTSKRPDRSAARRNAIGRLALWSFTGTLVFGGLGTLSSALWLLPVLRSDPQFIAAHTGLLFTAFAFAAALFIVLFFLQRFLVPHRGTAYRSLDGARVHVGLTAFNDAEAIRTAASDFAASRAVHKVIVVDNNSTDGTAEAARAAGAEVVVETVPGYGSCCMRALSEASRGADVVVLCEGDMTFSAEDVKKLLPYLENCDLVLGTRATQELREPGTQMDWLINPVNQVVAKLIQVRFWGTRLTDVGCTYRAMRVDAYEHIRDRLRVRGNHFSRTCTWKR